MRQPNDIYVRIQSTNIRLGVLDSTVFERIKRLYTILPQINELDSHIKYIDLTQVDIDDIRQENHSQSQNKKASIDRE